MQVITLAAVAFSCNSSQELDLTVMKSYCSLFPCYYFRDDDAAVFFELSEKCDLSITSTTDNQSAKSVHVKYEPITGSQELVSLLKRAKEVSNSFGRKTFEELRGKTNYYEGLGKGCFLNRSAMKLVNLDYAFSLIEPSITQNASSSSSSSSYSTSTSSIFSSSCTRNGQLEDDEATFRQNEEEYSDSYVVKSPHFTFLDLCGGPGGFIEYIVLKCRHEGTPLIYFSHCSRYLVDGNMQNT